MSHAEGLVPLRWAQEREDGADLAVLPREAPVSRIGLQPRSR